MIRQREKRELLDKNSKKINANKLHPTDLMWAILKWSALPGLSRHHWGSDMDVIDLNALKEDQDYSLKPQEYAKGGIFEKLGSFLENTDLEQFNAFRPYFPSSLYIADEPWHLSFYKAATPYESSFNAKHFIELIQGHNEAEFALKTNVIEHLDEILAQCFYILK